MSRFAITLAFIAATVAVAADAQDATRSPTTAVKPGISADSDPEVPFPADLPIPPATVLTPEETLATFTLSAGFKIELVASEPMISAPVAMQFDSEGRLWVVEMNGFMPNVDGKGEDVQSGRVVVLEDTDNDGRMDKSTTFLDKLVLPRAIMLRKGGALVAVPPAVYWCPDSNGDLKADEQVLLVPNYSTGGNPEHMPNGLLLALDNWIYSAKSNRRFRFTQGGELKNETTLYRGQWGICQDNFGRLFYNYNSDQLRGDLLPSAYLSRNPNFKNVQGGNDQIARSQKVYPGRVTPGVNRGYRKGMLSEGKLVEFTAASGLMIYRGDLFPAEFRENSFVPEPSANLIKRNIHAERDGDMMASDAYERREFLTSTSERFRPVNIYNGPDGAIYVTDMARGVIQHITYVTPWLRRNILERGLEQPLNQGRVWRIVPENVQRRPAPRLGKLSSADLIAELGSGNGWTRDTAQRLLVERAEAASVPLLEKAAQRADNALMRLHALWTLEGLGKLGPQTVMVCLKDAEAKTRAAAVRLAEPLLKNDTKLEETVLALSSDKSAEVQIQLLLTLSGIHTAQAEAARLAVLNECSENRLARSALLSGLRGRELNFLRAVLASPQWENESPGRTDIVAQLARCLLEERNPEHLNAALDLVARETARFPWQQIAILSGLTGAIVVPQAPPDSIAAQQAKRGMKPQSTTALPQNFKAIKMPAEPAQLAVLASSTNPEIQQRAIKLATLFVWPGKPGVPEERKLAPLTSAQKEFIAAGKQLYLVICAACHQPAGQGQEGMAPPLANSDWASGSEGRLVRVVLQGVGGPMSVNNKDYNLDMPGLGQALTDEQIAQILSYIRRDLGNEAPIVETAGVKKIRDQTKDRGASWSAEELQALP